MRRKVSDYIAEYVVSHGVRNNFSVVGGGAMHLNDSLGHQSGLHTTYHHHEQAAAIAAESYYRVNNEPALLCVTSGPGAINALNGVAGAYMDSIPMIVLSGQTKSTLTVQHSRLPLRTLGNQEFDIIPCVKGMTKYSVMVMDASEIKKHLDIAFHMANTGRKGPCWLDIPLDIQGAYVETEDLAGYDPEHDGEIAENSNGFLLPREVPSLADTDWDGLLERILKAKRPVFYGGNAIRLSGGYDVFRKLVEKLQIPVVRFEALDAIAEKIRESHPDIVLSVDSGLTDEEIEVYRTKYSLKSREGISSNRQLLLSCFRNNDIKINVWNKIYKSSLLKKALRIFR